MNQPEKQVNYDDLIPNNVNLSEDRALRRALEQWHPKFIEWWKDMGPEGFQESQVYLRTAVGVDPKGWAVFDYVTMPEYRWESCWPTRKKAGPYLSESTRANRYGRRYLANTAPSCDACWLSRVTPSPPR